MIVGCGFGGLAAARMLDTVDIDLTVIDRANHHLFQPLLYQAATGVLPAGELARPLRDLLHHQPNTRVVLGNVECVDLAAHHLTVSTLGLAQIVPFDSLVVATGVETDSADPDLQRISAATKIWAAGVQASPLGLIVAHAAGVDTDHAGRVRVRPDCTLPGHANVFVIGDLMALDRLPGLAPVAIQSGRHAARTIRARLRGDLSEPPFRYRDRGTLATISRFRAIAHIGPLRLWGLPAWVLWLTVHLLTMTGFKNRAAVLLNWTLAFLGRARPDRVITIQQAFARDALADLGARQTTAVATKHDATTT